MEESSSQTKVSTINKKTLTANFVKALLSDPEHIDKLLKIGEFYACEHWAHNCPVGEENCSDHGSDEQDAVERLTGDLLSKIWKRAELETIIFAKSPRPSATDTNVNLSVQEKLDPSATVQTLTGTTLSKVRDLAGEAMAVVKALEKEIYRRHLQEVKELTLPYGNKIPLELMVTAPDLQAHHNPDYVPPTFHQEKKIASIKAFIASLE
jgi:hypothetical protein